MKGTELNIYNGLYFKYKCDNVQHSCDLYFHAAALFADRQWCLHRFMDLYWQSPRGLLLTTLLQDMSRGLSINHVSHRRVSVQH